MYILALQHCKYLVFLFSDWTFIYRHQIHVPNSKTLIYRIYRNLIEISIFLSIHQILLIFFHRTRYDSFAQNVRCLTKLSFILSISFSLYEQYRCHKNIFMYLLSNVGFFYSYIRSFYMHSTVVVGMSTVIKWKFYIHFSLVNENVIPILSED